MTEHLNIAEKLASEKKRKRRFREYVICTNTHTDGVVKYRNVLSSYGKIIQSSQFFNSKD